MKEIAKAERSTPKLELVEILKVYCIYYLTEIFNLFCNTHNAIVNQGAAFFFLFFFSSRVANNWKCEMRPWGERERDTRTGVVDCVRDADREVCVFSVTQSAVQKLWLCPTEQHDANVMRCPSSPVWEASLPALPTFLFSFFFKQNAAL